MRKLALGVASIVLAWHVPNYAFAQAQPQNATASVSNQQLLAADQLDALLAPIALYPDALLSEILMASTYPLEVVEADRWVDANKSLKGDALKTAVDQQSWDDSIKSLTATPSVLDMMSQKLDWTQKLGDAVLAQQPDVMDAIQRLRQKAQANNKLTSTKQQTVSTQQQGGNQVIVIASTDPDTVYVPYYDPAVVYGAWPNPAYPPYYWPAPGYVAAGVIATGLAFGAGYAVGRWAAGGNYWGGGFNWSNNNINVNRSVNINNINAGNNWTHNPAHRQGVRYANTDVAAKFGNRNNIAGGAQNRMDFRGRSGQQVLNPAGGGNARPGNLTPGAGGAGTRDVGNRSGASGAGTRDVGNRPGGGAGTRQTGNRPEARSNNANRQVSNRASNNALGNISSGRTASLESSRGRASLGGGGGGGGPRVGGGGRRSDERLKHDITLLGRLNDGLGFYRFVYNGGHVAYVGVMAQEVQSVIPEAVTRGRDGYLRVFYDKLGLKLQTYDEWIASGARLPIVAMPY